MAKCFNRSKHNNKAVTVEKASKMHCMFMSCSVMNMLRQNAFANKNDKGKLFWQPLHWFAFSFTFYRNRICLRHVSCGVRSVGYTWAAALEWHPHPVQFTVGFHPNVCGAVPTKLLYYVIVQFKHTAVYFGHPTLALTVISSSLYDHHCAHCWRLCWFQVHTWDS